MADIRVRIVADEPRAALDIIERSSRHQQIDSTAWRRLFDSEGYRALVARDSTFGVHRNDSAFRALVLTDSLAAIRDSLRMRVDAMATLDVRAAAGQALGYAPAGAHIHATIFPVIKPFGNSFVFGPDSSPQIFLFVNVNETPAHFRNRLTHELHHVALNSVCSDDPGSVAAGAGARAGAQGRRALGASRARGARPVTYGASSGYPLGGGIRFALLTVGLNGRQRLPCPPRTPRVLRSPNCSTGATADRSAR